MCWLISWSTNAALLPQTDKLVAEVAVLTVTALAVAVLTVAALAVLRNSVLGLLPGATAAAREVPAAVQPLPNLRFRRSSRPLDQSRDA